jgi:hypothetical protein
MGTHMKTTVDIADSLLAEAKQTAAQRNTTLRALIEEGLELVLRHDSETTSFRLGDASVKGKGARRWHEWSDDQRTAAMYGEIA